MTPQPPITQVSAVTQCPHCNAKFRVRPEQVQVHAGLVRCGACRGIFDAIEHLVEGMLPPARRIEDPATLTPPQTIIQGMPEISVADRDDEVAVAVAAAPAAKEAIDAPAAKLAVAPEAAGADAPVRNLDARDTEPSAVHAQPASDMSDYRWRAPARPTTPAMRWTYALLSLLALLGLLAQGAYFFRDELASRVPETVPLLTAACEALSCRVEPPRRAESLGFVGADLAADPSHKGLLTFTATLRNTGSRAVAFPHLVLSLDGLGGELAVRRVFAPAEFAPATANLAKGLEGGAEIEIKLYLDASQTNVVGFKVDHVYL
jgi:predicted Zn finger-like uncharacterized protein